MRSLRSLIAVCPPGDRLPGMRALAARFSTSTFTVQRAMDALALEGLLERRSRSGVRISSNAPLLVLVAEDQPWQRRFWETAVAGFRSAHAHPVELRCLAGHVGMRQAVAALGGRSAILVSVPCDALELPVKRLGDLLEAGQLDVLRRSVLPLLRPAFAGATMPYQAQPAAWVVPVERKPADVEWNLARAARWLAQQAPQPWVPPPLFGLLDAVGLHPRSVIALPDGERTAVVRRRLTTLVERTRSLGACGCPISSDTARTDGCAAVVRSGWMWPRLGVRAKGSLALLPMPIEPEGTRQANPIYAAAIGEGCGRAHADFLVWLLSPTVQRAFAQTAFGMPVTEAALALPGDDLPPGFAAIAATLLAPTAVLPLDGQPVLDGAVEAVLDRLVLPALLGEEPATAELDTLAQRYANRSTVGSRQRLRQLLLAS